MMRGGISRIDAITRTVVDLDEAERFYRDALNFAAVDETIKAPKAEAALLGLENGQLFRRTLRLGAQTVILLGFEPPGIAYPEDSTSTDLWFQHCAIVVSDINTAFDRVMAAGARPISQGGPQRLPANTGGVSAFKFRDPFGHPVELLHFPDGVGSPVWHGSNTALLKGIDHTALAVSSCERSKRFYADLLRLEPQAHTHNRGPAQTRLDAIPSDDVDVEALAPASVPPHLELLAYRTGTRRALIGANPPDAVVARTIATGDIEAIVGRFTAHGCPEPRRGTWNEVPAIAFSDPDGHEWVCLSDASPVRPATLRDDKPNPRTSTRVERRA